jgi:hypothetical protein
MAMNESKIEITRMFPRVAVLTFVCCLAVCSLLPAQAQPAIDTSMATRFQADATNPSMPIPTEMEHSSKAHDPREALPLTEDFSRDNSFALLHADKSPGLAVDLRGGYGQIFQP